MRPVKIMSQSDAVYPTWSSHQLGQVPTKSPIFKRTYGGATLMLGVCLISLRFDASSNITSIQLGI